MSAVDARRDPGVAWILPAYRQYRLPLCFRGTGETSLSPTSDRWLQHFSNQKASRCNNRVHGE